MEAALQVLPIDQRREIPREAIQSVVDQIVTNFSPFRIYLFGSYATGKQKPESDIDLLVVMDTENNGVNQAVEILRKIKFHFGLDLIVYSPQILNKCIEWGDSFLRDIVENGKILYESSDA